MKPAFTSLLILFASAFTLQSCGLLEEKKDKRQNPSNPDLAEKAEDEPENIGPITQEKPETVPQNTPPPKQDAQTTLTPQTETSTPPTEAIYSFDDLAEEMSKADAFFQGSDTRKVKSALAPMEGKSISLVLRVREIDWMLSSLDLTNQFDIAFQKVKGLKVDFHSSSAISEQIAANDIVHVTAKISHFVIFDKGHYSISLNDLRMTLWTDSTAAEETLAIYEWENGIAKSCQSEKIAGKRSLVEQKVESILASIQESNGSQTLDKGCQSGGTIEFTHVQNGVENLSPTVTTVRSKY